VTVPDAENPETRTSFRTLADAVSLMAYLERIRTNTRREREERDLFFAQALVSRLLVQRVPKIKHLRIGCEHVRSLEAGGDFFDFIAKPDGSLLGFIGSCSGSGLRTVLEVCGIMREIHRSLNTFDRPSQVLDRINTLLVEETHRRHQASLCVFHANAVERRIRLAKSGRLGMLLGGPGGKITNISARGTNFLGMVPKLEFHDEEYSFEPGQSFACATEGFYAGHDKQELRYFLETVGTVLESRLKKPVVNAVFEQVNRTDGWTARPDASMLALSVEFLNNRESVRIMRQYKNE
jgi:serine phosphatase RsbU (regulator of sigma subunit)